MTRRALLGLAAAPAGAQVQIPCLESVSVGSMCVQPGHCPVCGTKAAADAPGFIFNIAGYCLDRDGEEAACSKSPRVIRCQHCSCAFWQDMETSK